MGPGSEVDVEKARRLGEVCFRLESTPAAVAEVVRRAEGRVFEAKERAESIERVLDVMWEALSPVEKEAWFAKGRRLLRRMHASGLAVGPLWAKMRERMGGPDGPQSVFGFSGAVAPGQIAALQYQPRVMARLGRLWVCETIARAFSICDVRIGNVSLLVGGQPVSAAAYSTDKTVDSPVDEACRFDGWPTVTPATCVTLLVKNEAAQHFVFKAFFEAFLPL